MVISGSFGHLDSPATTSSITYKIQVRTEGGATNYINRSINDQNSATGTRPASSILAMEIKG
jgi:hypothetical protein